MDERKKLLEVEGLKKYFPVEQGFLRKVVGEIKAVDDVNFFIRQGETLGLVGESGCGKTTVGRCIVRAYAPTYGQMLYQLADSRALDLAALPGKEIGPFRRD